VVWLCSPLAIPLDSISIVTRGGKGGMNSQPVTLIEQSLCKKIAFDLKRCDLMDNVALPLNRIVLL